MRNPLALLSSQLELRDRTRRQLREESFQAFEDVESSQYTKESGEFDTEACLDTLDGAFANARSLGEFRLCQACFDAVSPDSFTEDLGDGGISELRCNAHKSPLMANNLRIQGQVAISDELYEVNFIDATRNILRIVG
jgi:hypothetical protein